MLETDELVFVISNNEQENFHFQCLTFRLTLDKEMWEGMRLNL